MQTFIRPVSGKMRRLRQHTATWLRAVHEPGYLKAKRRDLASFITFATVITAFFVVNIWVWDYAIDPAGMPEAFGLRMAQAATVAALAALMYLRAPAWLLRFGLFAVPAFVQITFIEVLARLDGGASFGIGGFLYFFIFVPFMALAESLRFKVLLMAFLAAFPNALRLLDVGEHLDLAVYNAYSWMVYGPVVMILALIEHLLHSVFMSRSELRRQAMTDHLTGTGNRLHFSEQAQRAFQVSRSLDQPVSVLFVDADHFKRLNDQHGHAYGDRVLRALAERIRGVIRETDILARYGGEEFVIFLPNAGAAIAAETAERIRQHIAAQPLAVEEISETLTVSVGAASALASTDVSLSAMLAAADDALYRAKDAGRNRVMVTAMENR